MAINSVNPLNIATLFACLIVGSCGGGGGGGSGSTPSLAPVVNFSGSNAEVLVGNTATLTWASTGSSSCTASGGWTGSKETSGSATVTVPSAGEVAYNLACVGDGGTTLREITISGYQEVSGVTVDGYIRGADVFIDKNDNFVLDGDEVSTVSSNDGTFRLRYSDGNLISLGGFDLESGNSLHNLLIVNKLTTYAEFAAITPITTIAAFMENPDDIYAVLGIDPRIDISSTDPVLNLGDGGIYDHLYEKGNQITILVMSLQNVANDLNGLPRLR